MKINSSLLTGIKRVRLSRTEGHQLKTYLTKTEPQLERRRSRYRHLSHFVCRLFPRKNTDWTTSVNLPKSIHLRTPQQSSFAVQSAYLLPHVSSSSSAKGSSVEGSSVEGSTAPRCRNFILDTTHLSLHCHSAINFFTRIQNLSNVFKFISLHKVESFRLW